MAASLVEINKAPTTKRHGARLEGIAGWVVEVGSVGDPPEDEKLGVIECEIHAFSLTAAFWHPSVPYLADGVPTRSAVVAQSMA